MFNIENKLFQLYVFFCFILRITFMLIEKQHNSSYWKQKHFSTG